MNNKDFTFYSIKSCTDPQNAEADFSPAIGALLNDDIFVGGYFDIKIDFRNQTITLSTNVDDALDHKDYVANISNLKINGEDASDMDPDELIAALKEFAQPDDVADSRFTKSSPIKDIAAGAGVRISYNRERGVYTIHSNLVNKINELGATASTFLIKDVKAWKERPSSSNTSDPKWVTPQEDDSYPDIGESSGLLGYYD